MCHLLLVMPLAALPLFWLLPLPAAAVLYAAAAAVSGLVYWQAILARRQPRQNGVEAWLGDTGIVLAADGKELVVQVHNELWHADSVGERPVAGDAVKVKGCGDLLVVEKIRDARDHAQGHYRC